MEPLTRLPALPERLAGLAGLATNLWWSWHRESRMLFRAIDEVLWHRTRHNPLELLQEVEPQRLAACAANPEFLALYDRASADLAHALTREGTWFRRRFPEFDGRPIAYFSAEFAVHNSVPIYSGGLGVLAGDHCKTASDLGVPLVGVGLMYTKGYFDQQIRLDGWQQDVDDPVDPSRSPLLPVLDETGSPYLVTVPCADREVHVGAWLLRVGAVPLYLLDTNLERNEPADQALSHKLYAGGAEMRLRQEWVLGAGGVRVLRRLGIDPTAWHANEGHAAFMFVERLRELMLQGKSLSDARVEVRGHSVFTTHTPVPAGHDRFSQDQVERCIGPYWESMGIDRETFFGLGRHPVEDHGQFHMTALAIRLAGSVNAVSALHGEETRHIWHVLWPDRERGAVPIEHVTNGVHLATWMAPQIMDLLSSHLGPDWGARLDSEGLWDAVLTLDDAQLWQAHCSVRERLLDFIREDARRRWREQWKEPGHLVAAGTLLDPHALTIGFARRFATYKRADLLFRDPDRLRRILTPSHRPVQLVFAGKAHPADEPAKHLLQRVYGFTRDATFEGRITFLEDYEMHLAHRLVQGVDLWLNVPRVPMEACGTSGMKAALNGVPQVGTLDGWWAEGWTGRNGWAIPKPDDEEVDEHDAEHLYQLLEEEIVPLYYRRDDRGVPLEWVGHMKHAIREAGERFAGRRMVQQYVREYYVPAMAGQAALGDPPTA
ncbi:MAG: alpha-glucan family phosphorylase [Gemmatimonadota bacterium]|nr:alpha-glucan family phosphorylase [Gemmatimonadota bacterium]MDH5196593.1 alpha-glucan family phosphorylase [Gemmatimonadota bacterium]